jgi:hypothetical protein
VLNGDGTYEVNYEENTWQAPDVDDNEIEEVVSENETKI